MRKYFYNPKINNRNKYENGGQKFDKVACKAYIESNRWLNKQLDNITGMPKRTLKCVLLAYAAISTDFNTFASQANIAKIACVSVKTVGRALKLLRQNNILRTWHRYRRTPGQTRRVTSQTFLLCFAKFCDWLRTQTIRAANEINKLKMFIIDKTTGEILGKNSQIP